MAITNPPDNWAPIETGPTDGRDVLVTVAYARQLVARWRDGQWIAADSYPVSPTHWQDLPAPPKKVL